MRMGYISALNNMTDIMDEIEALALGIAPPQKKPPAKGPVKFPTEEKQLTEETTPLVEAFQAKGIRIRGNVDEPLICVADTAMYIGDTNYSHRIEKYLAGEHVQMLMSTDKRGQKRQMQYFSEEGFYKYMMQSKGEKAEEFQRFVYKLLKEERKKTVDSIQLALKIARTEAEELRKEKAALQRKQTSIYLAANDAKERAASLENEVKTLRKSKSAAADAEEMRLMGRGGERIKGWNC